jgi:outer membrane protein, multidrug efflux system
MKRFVQLMVSIGAALLGGCDLAPAYDPPRFVVPDSYQGSGPFQVAHPDERPSIQEAWWTLFADPELDRLEDQLTIANPTLQAAAAAYTQARALAAEAQSALYPQLGLQAASTDNGESTNRLFGTGPAQQASSNQIGASASWEPDFWDAIRNTAHAQKRLAQASAADFSNARLSLQAELASDYVAVRGLDAELEVLRQIIEAYRQAVEVARLRSQGQIASGLDLARSLSELKVAQAQETETALGRDLMQHAVAVLTGSNPSQFVILPVKQFALKPPSLPLGIPSELLQRRPDIASAERHMAAANASIGVARAAFYPHVVLGGNAGFEDTAFNLFSMPNSLWSIGPAATLPLFEGGFRRAQLMSAWSQYSQLRDTYRATVLAAFQDVEDGLSLTRRLGQEVAQEHEASEQATQALAIATLLYTDGLDDYLNVAVAQEQALSVRTSEVQLQIRQLQASVSLARALGGGWSVQALPTEKDTLPFAPLDYRASTKP